MAIKNYFDYPKWAGAPGRWHATMYVSPDQPADVVSYGTRVVNGRRLPIVKFTGFSEDDGAGALSLQRLAEAMKIIINHAARSCRLPVNHSGSAHHTMREVVEDGQKYQIYSVPVYLRALPSAQKYITVRVWKGGSAAGSVVVSVPPLVMWDIPTMAQFERVVGYAADLARSL